MTSAPINPEFTKEDLDHYDALSLVDDYTSYLSMDNQDIKEELHELFLDNSAWYETHNML